MSAAFAIALVDPSVEDMSVDRGLQIVIEVVHD